MGKREHGRLMEYFKVCIKANIAHMGIAPKQFQECAQERTGCHTLTREATETFEENRCDSINEALENGKGVVEAPKLPG